MARIRIGTRGSHLALLQAEKVATCFRENGIDYEICPQKTTADRFLDTPLTDLGGKALFSKELDRALLQGKVDICVHSLKDLESRLHPELAIIATLQRDPAHDMFVLHPDKEKNHPPIADANILWNFLPFHATVATCAPRRKAFLLQKRPDLKVVAIRGNIERRLALLEKKNYHAIVLSQASFLRSDRSMQQTRLIDPSDMLPAATQGVIAIVGLPSGHQRNLERTHPSAHQAIARIHHPTTFFTSTLEREILYTLGCNCHSSVAAFARFETTGDLKIQAEILSPDGTQHYSVTESLSGLVPHQTDAQDLGKIVGHKLLQKLPPSFLAQLQLQPNS